MKQLKAVAMESTNIAASHPVWQRVVALDSVLGWGPYSSSRGQFLQSPHHRTRKCPSSRCCCCCWCCFLSCCWLRCCCSHWSFRMLLGTADTANMRIGFSYLSLFSPAAQDTHGSQPRIKCTKVLSGVVCGDTRHKVILATVLVYCLALSFGIFITNLLLSNFPSVGVKVEQLNTLRLLVNPLILIFRFAGFIPENLLVQVSLCCNSQLRDVFVVRIHGGPQSRLRSTSALGPLHPCVNV